MIWSISKQPDYKVFLSEEELKKLKQSELSWTFFDNNNWKLVDIILKNDTNLKDWATRDGFLNLVISDQVFDELSKSWFVWWLRLNWNTVKITIVVKERLKNLLISKDDLMNLEWALDSLETRINNK